MEELIKMLEALVSQGEAQFNCGDCYATFNKQTIEHARRVLNNHKPLTLEEAGQITNFTDTCDSLSHIEKAMVSAYMVGQADANLAEPLEAVKNSIRIMLGKNLTFTTN